MAHVLQVAISFLERLLLIRRNILKIPVDDSDPDIANEQDTAIVTWVDVLFARLGEVIVVVSEGRCLEDIITCDRVLSSSLQVQRNHEALRIACQLPRELAPYI